MKHSALIIDVQRDFTVNRAASIIPGTIQTVPYIKNLVKEYRRLAYPIIHVVRLYNTDGSNVDLCGKQIVISGSDGAELIDELKPFTTARMNSNLLLSGKLQKIGSMEWIMYKPRWGAFYNTPLEKHLDSLDVNTVVVCGCNFPNRPRTTIYEASERDFRIVLITDATSVIYNIGLRELKNIGVSLMKSKDCISLLVDMQKDMYT